MKNFLLALIFLLTVCISCEKSEPFETEITTGDKKNQSLIITTTHLYRTHPQEDSLISDVLVKLYTSRYNRDFDLNVRMTGLTDSLGYVKFQYLSEPYYFTRAQHPIAGELLDEVSIPENAIISYLDLIFY